ESVHAHAVRDRICGSLIRTGRGRRHLHIGIVDTELKLRGLGMAEETAAQQVNIDSILQEQRTFEPSQEFRQQAHIKSHEDYERLYKESIDDPEKFWAGVAKELHWFKPWHTVLEWDCPWAKWFAGGEMNLSYNCLDLQVAKGRGNKTAIIWEGEPGEIRTYTYSQLLAEVQKFANALRGLGIKK